MIYVYNVYVIQDRRMYIRIYVQHIYIYIYIYIHIHENRSMVHSSLVHSVPACS